MKGQNQNNSPKVKIVRRNWNREAVEVQARMGYNQTVRMPSVTFKALGLTGQDGFPVELDVYSGEGQPATYKLERVYGTGNAWGVYKNPAVQGAALLVTQR